MFSFLSPYFAVVCLLWLSSTNLGVELAKVSEFNSGAWWNSWWTFACKLCNMTNVNFAFKMCLAAFIFCSEQCSISLLQLIVLPKASLCKCQSSNSCMSTVAAVFLHFARKKKCRKWMNWELRANYLTFSHWFSGCWAFVSFSIAKEHADHYN